MINNILDEIFSTWSHVAVLRVMQRTLHGISGREIARLSNMNHRACLNALTNLENLSVVSRQRGGREHLFTLNRDHQLVAKGIIPLLKLERDYLDSIKNYLKRYLKKYYSSMILFGSVARNQENVMSDVDICFIVDHFKDKSILKKVLYEINPSLKKHFGINVSATIVLEKEFQAQRKILFNNIVKEGILLDGKAKNLQINR